MNRLNETQSAVYEFCRFSLFLKDLFFLDCLYVNLDYSNNQQLCLIYTLHTILTKIFDYQAFGLQNASQNSKQ